MSSPATRAAGRRGLIVVVLIGLILLAMADLLRRDSFLRGLFGATPASRQQQVIEGVRRSISMDEGARLPIPPGALAEAETLAA